MSGIEFERWFLVVYTLYTIIAIFALMWAGRDDEQRARDETFIRTLKQRFGDWR